MRFTSSASASAALFATLVAGHGAVDQYTMNGVVYKGWQAYNGAGQVTIEREVDTYNPLYIADLSGVQLRCNTNPVALGTGPSGTVAAGSSLIAHWAQWTHSPGPVMVYMAACPSSGCNSWDGSGTVWFKIDQAGLLSGTQANGTWGLTEVLNTLTWTSTIPASLAPGEYLIRHELLALHQANNPQFYPECAQLIVTGSGTSKPSGSYLVSFPGAYDGTAPNINMDIYSAAASTITTYDIPGPSVWPGTGGSSPVTTTSAGPVPTSKTTLTTSVKPTTAPTTSVKPTTTTTTTTSKPVTTTTPPSSCTAAAYGQCGGTGWTGCTTCASGYTCKVSNPYYSQCL